VVPTGAASSFRGGADFSRPRPHDSATVAVKAMRSMLLHDIDVDRRLTNRASAAGARIAGAPRARSLYATRQAHKRNSSLLGRARQLQALVRPRHFSSKR
jgi:hypothetical protein